MIIPDYDEQSSFLANKMKEATLFELNSAREQGRLQYLAPESIEGLAEIVYQYYKEYNRPFGGGMKRGNINDVIEICLIKYYEAKNSLGEYEAEKVGKNEWQQLLIESANTFANNVSGIDLKFVNCDISGMRPHEFVYNFLGEHPIVESPILEFGWIGNTGSFAIGREGEDGVPVRHQYMDEGKILPKPIKTHYDHGKWILDETSHPVQDPDSLTEI